MSSISRRGPASLRTDSGAGNWREDAAVNLPIVEGKLAARLVVGQEHDSGWINSPLGNNINDGDLKNVRLKVNAQPIDDLSIKLGATHEEGNFGAPPEGTKDFTASTKDQPIASRFSAYDMKVDYQFPWFSVSSASSYFTFLNDGSLDVAPGVATPPLTTRQTSRVFSEELNLKLQARRPVALVGRRVLSQRAGLHLSDIGRPDPVAGFPG